MTKGIIEVPDFNPESIFYLIEATEYRYEYGYGPRKSRSSFQPITSSIYSIRDTKEWRYWSKFIFKTKWGDPLEPLWKIQNKFPKLSYKKFIFERQEEFPPLKIKSAIKGEKPKPNRDYGEVYYEVKYLEINESLLTYLKNKVREDDIKLVNKLQELFVNKSTHLSWDEFTERKGKFLLELDLSNYVDELNKQTNKKIKVNK